MTDYYRDRGRGEDEGRDHQVRYSREYDSQPRSTAYSQSRDREFHEPMSPETQKGHQAPANDDDDMSEEEIAAQIERLKMRQQAKAARRTANQASQAGSTDSRSRNDDSGGNHRGHPQSSQQPYGSRGREEPPHIPRQDRSGNTRTYQDQALYSPPAARNGREDTEPARSSRTNQDVGLGRPAPPGNRLDPTNSKDFIPQTRQPAPERDDHYKHYQGQRISSNVFSPGYGFRPSVPRNDTLPDPEELVGPHGSVHRIYPAPCPVSAPINANDGWAVNGDASSIAPDHPPSSRSSRPPPGSPVTPFRQQERPISPPPSEHASVGVQEEGQGHEGSNGRDRPPHLRDRIDSPRATPSGAATGSMVPWTGGVEYANDYSTEIEGEKFKTSNQGPMIPFEGGVVYKQESLNDHGPAMTIDELLSCFKDRRRDAPFPPREPYGGPRGGGSGYNPPRQQDSGWNRPAHGGDRRDWGSRDQPKDDGFGETAEQGDEDWGSPAGGDSKVHKNDNSGWDNGASNKSSWGVDGEGGYGGQEPRGGYGGGGGRACYNCGQDGHMSRDCPEPRKNGGGGGGGGNCYNCDQAGHQSRDCPEPRKGGGGGGNCYNCNEPGHQSRDCPEPRKPGTFRGTCNSCGQEGHRQSECPNGESQRGYSASNGYNAGGGGSWGKQNGDNDGRYDNGNINGNDWSNNSGHDAPPTRSAANVHPSRMGQVDHGSSYNRGSEPRRDYDQPPNDGRSRDAGWGGKGGQRSPTTDQVSRDPTPNANEDELGGW